MTATWLSVVSVVKDDSPALARTLRSLSQQDRTDVELVVVDSSADRDEVAALLETYQGAVSYRWVQPQGIYPAMNTAIESAAGEFAYFANAGDEFFRPDVLTGVRQLLRDHVWGFGPVEVIEGDGRRVFTPKWDYQKEAAKGFSSGRFPSHQGTFVRTSALRDLGGFDTSFSIAADYAMALKLSRMADPVILPFVVARFHEGGVSTQQWQASFAEFHRARAEILKPRGTRWLVEQFDTRMHWASVWVSRGMRPKLRRGPS